MLAKVIVYHGGAALQGAANKISEEEGTESL